MKFFASLYYDFNAYGSKKSCLRASFGFNRHFLAIGFHFSKPRGHKNCYWNKVKFHICVTYYLNGPLRVSLRICSQNRSTKSLKGKIEKFRTVDTFKAVSRPFWPKWIPDEWEEKFLSKKMQDKKKSSKFKYMFCKLNSDCVFRLLYIIVFYHNISSFLIHFCRF